MRIVVLAAALLAVPLAAQTVPPEQAALKAHVAYLASDDLRGREAGTADYERAADYVAAQFKAAGLQPAGDVNSYRQRVPLVAYRAADRGNVVLTRGTRPPVALAFGQDYLPGVNPAKAETAVDAPVVFVGRGIVAPQYGRDDYAGADVRGKIVALIGGSPADYTGEERAHFGSIAAKTAIAARKGAAGVLLLSDRALKDGGWDGERVTWATPAGVGSADGAPLLDVIARNAVRVVAVTRVARTVAG